MVKGYVNTLFAILLLTFAGTASADMVVLKSGEMFQTRRAWKEDGVVKYYRHGRVVSIGESEVERLIQYSAPAEDKLPSSQRPAVDPPSSTHAPAVPPLSIGNEAGYLDLRWGQPLSRLAGVEPAGKDSAYGGVQLYTQNQLKKRFGRARVDDIVYGFWQGGLYTIIVWTSNFLDFRELKAEAFRRFGEGIQNKDDVEKYFWTDKGADRMLSYSYETDTGYLWMRSRALHDRVRSRYPD